MAPAVQSSQIVDCVCVCRLGFPRVSRKSTCPRSTRWQLRLRPTEDFQTRVDLGATKVTREARARGDRSDINLTAAFSHRYVKLLKKQTFKLSVAGCFKICLTLAPTRGISTDLYGDSNSFKYFLQLDDFMSNGTTQ